MINRYSSRKEKLSKQFLDVRLQNALSYDRIAGYFSASIFEISGEAIESITGNIRMICNSSLEIEDVKTSIAAVNKIRQTWCDAKPEEQYSSQPKRLQKLYELIQSGKLQIKVLPDRCFGLIHGKAGVITMSDGTKTSFLGSVNETQAGWSLNYELLWEDNSPEAVNWVQEEFDALFFNVNAIPLPNFVVEDIKRIANRKVNYDIISWRREPNVADTVVESPINRKELGLWEHQKNFIHLAFEQHKKNHGARLVLADMVGLGKTVQLAISAKLMALWGEKPILIIVPKTLLCQWQDELKTLLDMPSAIWNGKLWIDENELEYPNRNPQAGILQCPRRIGIISQGLIIANSEVVPPLLSKEYECVIVDESHRARRKNLGKGKEYERPDPNNLYKFLLTLSNRTKSMLLATATPVQLYPIEAWDLLNILAQKTEHVLGSPYSQWRTKPYEGLLHSMGLTEKQLSTQDIWDWLRDPFPPVEEEEREFGRIRTAVQLQPEQHVIPSFYLDRLDPWDRNRIERMNQHFFPNHNPFIRYIIRRERSYLENTINPDTGESFLPKIDVKLFGDRPEDAIYLPSYLKQAYELATEFCNSLKKRLRNAGFMKTLLLRRMGSSIIAGKKTAMNFMENWAELEEEEDIKEEDMTDVIEEMVNPNERKMNLIPSEHDILERLIRILDERQIPDPKLEEIKNVLFKNNWIERGCIIFSQYFDSAQWIAKSLSESLPSEKIGLYAGGDKSGILLNGDYERKPREIIKQMVRDHEIRLLVGTDAASEGLNLQTLGTLINLDLPWNPTKLEQRKGRIQRIGQVYPEVWIYNMRYKESVEDRVHELLSERLENIRNMFGQIPDVLEDVWIDVALDEIESAKERINAIPKQHPFEIRYRKHLEHIDWESCSTVLDNYETKKYLKKGW